MPSYLTQILHQFPLQDHEQQQLLLQQAHSTAQVGSFGGLAEDLHLQLVSPKGFMTAGSGPASSTPRRRGLCSTTSDVNYSTFPSAGQNWERSDRGLASQLLEQTREALEDLSQPLDLARRNPLHGSQKGNKVREQTNAQARQLLRDKSRVSSFKLKNWKIKLHGKFVKLK